MNHVRQTEKLKHLSKVISVVVRYHFFSSFLGFVLGVHFITWSWEGCTKRRKKLIAAEISRQSKNIFARKHAQMRAPQEQAHAWPHKVF